MKRIDDKSGHKDNAVAIFIEEFFTIEDRGKGGLVIIFVRERGDERYGSEVFLVVKEVLSDAIDIVNNDGIRDIVRSRGVIAELFAFAVSDPMLLDQLDEFEVFNPLHFVFEEGIVVIFNGDEDHIVAVSCRPSAFFE